MGFSSFQASGDRQFQFFDGLWRVNFAEICPIRRELDATTESVVTSQSGHLPIDLADEHPAAWRSNYQELLGRFIPKPTSFNEMIAVAPKEALIVSSRAWQGFGSLS